MSFFQKYIHFYKSDRDAIIILAIVVVACVVLIPLLCDRDERTKDNDTYGKGSQYSSHKFYAQPGKNNGSSPAEGDCELFPFDPNTADSTQLLRLGLQPWQVRSIYKYRSKGGRFRKKEDFARLYGLTLEKYRQLEPYIRIKQEVMAADVIKSANLYSADNNVADGSSTNNNVAAGSSADNARTPVKGSGSLHGEGGGRGFKIHPGETIDINVADTTLLKRIPGIGSYFARRIVELRQRKQAFVSPKELLSIRNFPEETLSFMTCSQNFPKIHVNKLSIKELEHHPLLNYVQARDIVNLRKMTGSIHSAKELSSLPSFNAQLIERLTPFLVFD